ncbi:12659_t:CDS:2 [Ambispora leptoticha]|uniref:12659_t:CDS:1 n=1 Tax=Ambispora leptoticha TaxID=144679 RepID=A0A9N8V2L9_9GLOM|nr:12659_t:CDS:2 [Ambispora leptoticha]
MNPKDKNLLSSSSVSSISSLSTESISPVSQDNDEPVIVKELLNIFNEMSDNYEDDRIIAIRIRKYLLDNDIHQNEFFEMLSRSQNTPRSISFLAFLYCRGIGVAENKEKTFEVYQIAANMDDALAQNQLGWCYYYGIGTKVNYDKAFEWFQKSAKTYATGQGWLGVCYSRGHGVKQDYDEAFKWYKMAADAGDQWGAFHVGHYYREGIAVANPNQKEAVAYYRKSAEKQNITGQYWLGYCYTEGIGVEKDEKQGFDWFKVAADQGSGFCQFQVGCCYRDGIGVKKDCRKASYWFQLAANEEPTFYYLGDFYQTGTGVVCDIHRALRLLRKAKESEHIALY